MLFFFREIQGIGERLEDLRAMLTDVYCGVATVIERLPDM